MGTSSHQAVAHPSDCFEALSAQFVAQVGDVDVDDVRAGVEVEAPDVAQELFAAEYLARVAQEHLREGELAGRQVHPLAVDLGATGAVVQHQAAMFQVVDRCSRGFGFGPEPQPDPGQKFLEGERFRHVVVGAALQPRHPVGHRRAGREHDHRRRHPLAADAFQHLEPVDVRQPDVQDDQREVAVHRQRGPHLTGGRGLGGESCRLQPLGYEPSDPGFVLDDQYAAHCCGPLGSGAPSGSGPMGVAWGLAGFIGIRRVNTDPPFGTDSMSRCPP